jgi:two-component system sensor kinase FixL
VRQSLDAHRHAAAPDPTDDLPALADPRLLAEELAANEQRLRLAIDAGGFATWDAIRTSDAVEDIFWSQNYFAILGYPPDPSGRATRSMWRQRVHPDDYADVMAAWARAEAGNGVFHAVHRICLPDGSVRWTEAHGRVMRLPDGRRRSVGIVRDITARREAETRLRALQEAAVRAARLNAVGAMAAALAHELNQPLSATANYSATAIRVLQQLEAAGGAAPPALRLALEKIVEQTQRAASVVRRLRDCVAHDRPDMTLVAAATVVEDACAELRRTLPSTFMVTDGVDPVQLDVRVAPDLVDVFVDRERLQYVLVNLLRNAIEAQRGRALRHVLIAARRPPQGGVEFSVTDRGPGLAPGTEQRIFDAFASDKAGGMGMGLAICRTLVEEHGGTISAANAPEGGARFQVLIPDPASATGFSLGG